MSSIIPDRLARLWTYLRADNVTSADQQVSRRVSDSSRPSSVLQSYASQQASVVKDSVSRNDGKVVESVKPTSKNGGFRARGTRCFLRTKNAVWTTLLFVWTVVLTVAVVIRAAASLFIPDKWRKVRDIGKDVVLVTNAGRGLGRRLAIILGLKAALVVCWDPDRDRHMNTVYDIRHRGGRALGFTVDVTDETAVTHAAEAMKREVGPPGMLVMSAGRRPQRPLLHWAPDDLEEMYHANVTPHLLLLRTFLPEMLARNDGHLVCIISASACIPCCHDAPYAATKLGVAALMRGLADELEMHPANKIRLTCVYPYRTEKRPPLAKMAEVVVNQVLRGRRSVVVPKCPIFWLNLLRLLPAPARRRWRCFMSRLSYMNDGKTCFEKAYPWGTSCPRHYSILGSQNPSKDSFIKYAPYEMASFTSIDNVPLVLKKRNSNDYIEDEDSDSG